MKTTVHHLYPDIWQEVFGYFNATELFFSFVHITTAADEVLLNKNHHLHLRGLIVDASVETIPKKLSLSQVISLELHQESCLDIIGHCLELRSLKLIGRPEWAVSLLRKVWCVNMKLEQLTLIVPGVRSLYDLLASATTLLSLRRLEIYANELEGRLRTSSPFLTQTKIEEFILHSCSSISWDNLSHMLPGLPNIRFLDITLFHSNNNLFSSFSLPQLRCIHLVLVEVSFECIIQLVTTAPSLIKLKLNGLVNSEGFAINHKWLNLYESCACLVVVQVNLSLEDDSNSLCTEIIRMALCEINLYLKCIDNDQDYYLTGVSEHRWWNLSGMIIRHQCLIGKK